MITPVEIMPVSEIVNFRSGPFSDSKLYTRATRRLICQQLLRELAKHPRQNAASIILVNETMKGLG